MDPLAEAAEAMTADLLATSRDDYDYYAPEITPAEWQKATDAHTGLIALRLAQRRWAR